MSFLSVSPKYYFYIPVAPLTRAKDIEINSGTLAKLILKHRRVMIASNNPPEATPL